MMELMNSYENRFGEYIKVIISSRTGRDGINLSNITQEHLTGSEWTPSANYQALSRGIRATSHVDLLRESQMIIDGLTKALNFSNNSKTIEKEAQNLIIALSGGIKFPDNLSININYIQIFIDNIYEAITISKDDVLLEKASFLVKTLNYNKGFIDGIYSDTFDKILYLNIMTLYKVFDYKQKVYDYNFNFSNEPTPDQKFKLWIKTQTDADKIK